MSEIGQRAVGTEEDDATGVAEQSFTVPTDLDVDLLPMYLTESRELLDGAEGSLLALEDDPTNADAVRDLFRCFHSLKGNSAYFGLTPIATLAHDAEDLLSGVRDGRRRFDTRCAGLSLACVDTLRAFLESLEGVTPGDTLTCPAGTAGLLRALAQEADPDASPLNEAKTELPTNVGVAAGSAPDPEPEEAPVGKDPAGGEAARNRIVPSVRVPTPRLDRLLEILEELVISQAMVNQNEAVRSRKHPALTRQLSHISKIVRELHDLGMTIRTVPLGRLFQSTRRLARDLAHKCGKKVRVECLGEETEIDRSMVDALGDPLMHLVRNCLDHGLETPADRRAAHKDEFGTLRLSARSSGGKVIITLSDDGRGLNREAILRKALQRGLVDAASVPSDQEVFNLIFEPGFSTSAVVTDISGRGVGMDVVRSTVESLGGRVTLHSEPGRGTSFDLVLPLTLALTEGMLVRVEDRRYVIPTADIVTCVNPSPEDLVDGAGNRAATLNVQGTQMPLLWLSELFALGPGVEEPIVLVLRDLDRRFALVVDDLIGQHQLVTKPLGEVVGRVRGIAGGAILPDGAVGLIIDVQALLSIPRGGATESVPTAA